jgi:hypothetical protein
MQGCAAFFKAGTQGPAGNASIDVANAARFGDVIAPKLDGAFAEGWLPQEIKKRLRLGHKEIALAQREVETLPGQGMKSSPADSATARVAMPQSARCVRTACAMSGPVGHGGLVAFSASAARPACASSASNRS